MIEYNQSTVTLVTAEAGLLFVRDIHVMDKSGQTVLEVGDDTGMHDLPCYFIVPRVPVTIHYLPLINSAIREYGIDQDSNISGGNCEMAAVEISYCFVRGSQWPIPQRLLTNELTMTMLFEGIDFAECLVVP